MIKNLCHDNYFSFLSLFHWYIAVYSSTDEEIPLNMAENGVQSNVVDTNSPDSDRKDTELAEKPVVSKTKQSLSDIFTIVSILAF